MIVSVGYLALHPPHKLAEIGDSTRNNEVEIPLYLLGTNLLGGDVLQLQLLSHGLHHLDFLADRINQIEVCIGKHNCQRNAGEAASRAEVHNISHRLELQHLGHGQRMQHVMFHKVVHILAAYDVDFGVPVAIQLGQRRELLLLPLGQIGKVFQYKVHIVKCLRSSLAADNQFLVMPP